MPPARSLDRVKTRIDRSPKIEKLGVNHGVRVQRVASNSPTEEHFSEHAALRTEKNIYDEAKQLFAALHHALLIAYRRGPNCW